MSNKGCIQGNNRVQKFDSNENYITKWGSEAVEKDNLIVVFGISLNSEGNVYVINAGNYCIQIFAPL